MATPLEIEIRRLDRETGHDIFLELGALHVSELSAGFLSKLGAPAVATLYLYLATRHVVFAAFARGRVVGFVAGTVDVAMISKSVFLKMALVSWLRMFRELVRPANLFRAASLWKYLARDVKTDLPSAELLSIAVSPDFGRRGIGSRLVRTLEIAFVEKEVSQYKVAAAETQLDALAFYQKLGGREVEETDLGGLKTHVFVLKCPSVSGCTRP